ncbi:MAG: pyrimidine dimer DNA glycosylase/endonuclease V [Candidatus Thorarchaeota archaeon]
MQVFLLYPDLCKSVQCLDPDRKGNQVYNEAAILIKGGWKHHPASKMWKNYKVALAQYCLYGLESLESDGKLYWHWIDFYSGYLYHGDLILPSWLGDERVHSSHRAALLYKDYEYYKQFGWKEKPEMRYYWPCTST